MSQMFSQLRQICTFLCNFQNWEVVPVWTRINVSFFLRTANEILPAPVISERQYTFQKMSPQTLGMKAETTRVSHRNVVCFFAVCFSPLVPAVECLSLSVWSGVCADTRRLFFFFFSWLEVYIFSELSAKSDFERRGLRAWIVTSIQLTQVRCGNPKPPVHTSWERTRQWRKKETLTPVVKRVKWETSSYSCILEFLMK